ncbi:uncharacterized protein LOC120280101 isoform X2 [Dioscorea cayenensis subsp. rotundata]|uniref:Uncharacterized protein LOC120280101 isoform X2 n=1 Tax=Dioscorea cayennensis subsp. rotundata TaxID=55577 RepID=A0AB40CUF0_DIOCR|nr:uncharacterized protein LOC120280101 isoform X2 [Dioscorea cayenensis subsp. rotundata]
MLRLLFSRAAQRHVSPLLLNQQRGIHSRNKKAMELVAKGWSALQEVDRVIDYTELNDPRLIPLLRSAKENFELALEIDNMNTHARYWLGRMHFKYHVPGACKLIGAALLVEAANMGDADAQYELGCRMRVEGHAGAAIAYGALLLQGFDIPEAVTRFESGRSPCAGRTSKKVERTSEDILKIAKEQFQIAANSGCDLANQWLKRIQDYEKLHQQLIEEGSSTSS